MSWQDLLGAGSGHRTLPWVGGRQIHSADRSWAIRGALPREHGWYAFDTAGSRKATLVGPSEPDPDFETGLVPVKGYLVGDRLIPDAARVDPDPAKLVQQTEPVFLVEAGLDRFTRALTVRDRFGRLVFIRTEWPEGPEAEAQAAYQDRLDDLNHVKGVGPALDLAFRWQSYQRRQAEARVIEMRRRAEEALQQQAEAARAKQLVERMGTGAGRRELAQHDFEAACRAALRISGSELLDVLETRRRNEVRVQYRFRHRRLECVVERHTLRIIDSGVCLDDHAGTKGDTWFTLESLPAVIGQAMDQDQLVVWRHAPGDGRD
jgi:hypothetical protein